MNIATDCKVFRLFVNFIISQEWSMHAILMLVQSAHQFGKKKIYIMSVNFMRTHGTPYFVDQV